MKTQRGYARCESGEIDVSDLDSRKILAIVTCSMNDFQFAAVVIISCKGLVDDRKFV